MALLTLTDASLAYGHHALLDHAALSVEAGERIALVGRNGSGKSSLMKVLAGLELLDDGLRQQRTDLRLALVPQEPVFEPGMRVFDAVAEGVAEARALRERFASALPDEDLDALQARIEWLDGWTWEQRVEQVLQRLSLAPDVEVERLSGGLRKRVALARALVAQPELLLLDEPTNHLDVAGIEWLQALLTERRGSLVVISHDRAFIDAVASRIVELDRGVLRSYPGQIAEFEAARQRELEAEGLAAARADKLLAQEEVWVRQGVEARRTRSVGRVARLERLREQRASRRERLGKARLTVDAGEASGRIVAELDSVDVRRGGRTLVRGLSTTVLRGDKVGLIGPNGCGKTSLLKLILGELEPDAGRVRRGTRLRVAYFDQLRDGLDLEASVADSISPGSEWVEIGGQRQHVMGYLGQFLFDPQRARSPVRTLSGGERNRLLLARLFALPANLLVLDEPTNDLDLDTLDLLEALLQDYAGTVLLVSHDRRFLDNVVTSCLAFEGGDGGEAGRASPGLWREVEGGYADWRLQFARAAAANARTGDARAAGPSATLMPASARAVAASVPVSAAPQAQDDGPSVARTARQKLSYRETRELETLPDRIAALEAEQKTLGEHLADPNFYQREPRLAAEGHARWAAIEDELMACLERWEALSARAESKG
jgi:ATP-binding cassette subfamily F protein uup